MTGIGRRLQAALVPVLLAVVLSRAVQAQAHLELVAGVPIQITSVAATGTDPNGLMQPVHLHESIEAPWLAMGGRITLGVGQRIGFEATILTTSVDVHVTQDSPTDPAQFRGHGDGAITTAAVAVRWNAARSQRSAFHLAAGPALVARWGAGFADYAGRTSIGISVAAGASRRIASLQLRGDVGGVGYRFHLRQPSVIEPSRDWRFDLVASVGIVVLTF